jgi:hypothetical protein
LLSSKSTTLLRLEEKKCPRKAPRCRRKHALTKVGAEEAGAARDVYPLDNRHVKTLCFTGNAFI